MIFFFGFSFGPRLVDAQCSLLPLRQMPGFARRFLFQRTDDHEFDRYRYEIKEDRYENWNTVEPESARVGRSNLHSGNLAELHDHEFAN